MRVILSRRRNKFPNSTIMISDAAFLAGFRAFYLARSSTASITPGEPQETVICLLFFCVDITTCQYSQNQSQSGRLPSVHDINGRGWHHTTSGLDNIQSWTQTGWCIFKPGKLDDIRIITTKITHYPILHPWEGASRHHRDKVDIRGGECQGIPEGTCSQILRSNSVDS